jgi:phosphoglycolate phosphatase/pyrophosphatase PpaX
MREEYRIWRGHVADSVPAFYPGFVEVLRRFGAAGGLIVVVSHSDEEIIRRDYAAGAPGLELGAVYGWNEDERRRKPATRPLREIEARHGLSPRDILVVDDLRPGVVMAQGVGADVAAAGWAHRIPEIEAYMREACTFYLEQTAELAAVLGLG